MIRAHLAIETTGMNTATAVGSEGFAQDDGRERRMRNKAFHTAVALNMPAGSFALPVSSS